MHLVHYLPFGMFSHWLFTVCLIYNTERGLLAPNNDFENLPPLIDSLIISRGKESVPESENIEILQVPSATGQHKEDTNSYPLAERLPSKDLKKSRTDLLQSSRNELTELPCPNVYCFTRINHTTSKTYLTCSGVKPSVGDFNDRIDCRYWKSATSQQTILSNEKGETWPKSMSSKGRGYDLKIILRPVALQGEQVSATERRIQVDYLTPGILEWAIKVIRGNLQLTFSPVHLTMSFIYIVNLRRVDLANLPTRSHVTRMSLWNPFNWEEDSFIPMSTTETMSSAAGTHYENGPIIQPPYFRLTIFCDHANRKAAFRRLWLPWKSWQVQLEHCHGLFVCHAWISQYQICDRTEGVTFEPTFFVHPKTAMESNTVTDLRPVYTSGLQRLYNSHCEKEPSPWDPLDDLSMNYEAKCWQRGVHVNKIHSAPAREDSRPAVVQSLVTGTGKSIKSAQKATKRVAEPSSNSVATASVNIGSVGVFDKKQPEEGNKVKDKVINRPVEPAKAALDKIDKYPIVEPSTSNHSAPKATADIEPIKQVERSTEPPNVVSNVTQTYLVTAVVVLSLIILLLLVILLLFGSRRRNRIANLPVPSDVRQFSNRRDHFAERSGSTDTNSSAEMMLLTGDGKSGDHLPFIWTPRLLHSTSSLHRGRAKTMNMPTSEWWMHGGQWEVHHFLQGTQMTPILSSGHKPRSLAPRSVSRQLDALENGNLQHRVQRKRTESAPGTPNTKQRSRSPMVLRKENKPHTLIVQGRLSEDILDNWPRGLHSFFKDNNAALNLNTFSN